MGTMSRDFAAFANQSVTVKGETMTLMESNFGRIVKGTDWEKKLYATLESIWKNIARYLMSTEDGENGRTVYAERADKAILAYLDHVGLSHDFAKAVWTSANTRCVKSKDGTVSAKMANKNTFQKSILRLTAVAFLDGRWIDVFEIKERNSGSTTAQLSAQLSALIEQNNRMVEEQRQQNAQMQFIWKLLTAEQLEAVKANMAVKA